MGKGNYKSVIYKVAIEVAKPQDDVFNHLVNIKNWWPEDFEGEDLKLNSEFILTIGDSHYSKNKVIEYDPNNKLVWLVTASNRKSDDFDWTDTKMIFELTPIGDNTQLKFIYDGVVLEDESDRLIQICDKTIKEMFYNYLINGKGK
jgi:hypothetical protein